MRYKTIHTKTLHMYALSFLISSLSNCLHDLVYKMCHILKYINARSSPKTISLFLLCSSDLFIFGVYMCVKRISRMCVHNPKQTFNSETAIKIRFPLSFAWNEKSRIRFNVLVRERGLSGRAGCVYTRDRSSRYSRHSWCVKNVSWAEKFEHQFEKRVVQSLCYLRTRLKISTSGCTA